MRALRNASLPELQYLAKYIYDRIYHPYTLRQWGMGPGEVDPSVLDRVPIRISHEDRYFTDKHQGIPIRGYAALIVSLLDHPLIEVRLNACFEKIRDSLRFDRLFHSGSIDNFFNYRLGVLPYRSIRFETSEWDMPFFQECAVENHPEAAGYTRIIEFKQFLDTESQRTVVAHEFPETHVPGKNEPFYPIENKRNRELHQRYREIATECGNIWFFGRLGDYRYYNMDETVRRALDLFETVAAKR